MLELILVMETTLLFKTLVILSGELSAFIVLTEPEMHMKQILLF